MIPRNLFFAFVLSAGAIGIGCGGPDAAAHLATQVTDERVLVPTEGAVLAIAPPDTPRSWNGAKTFKRTSQLVDAFAARGWPVIAPWEYRVIDTVSDDLITGTSLTAVARQLGIERERLWIVRFKVHEATASSEVTGGKTGTENRLARSFSHHHQIEVSIEDPRIKRTLATLSATVIQDAFDEEVDVVDPLPNLSQTLVEIADAITDELETLAAAPPLELDHGIEVASNPKRVETYAPMGQASLNDTLRDYDEFERLARLVVHYQFFLPEIEVDELSRFRKEPPGLLVADPGILEGVGVVEGDYIIEGNGLELAGVHSLERFLRLDPPGTSRLVLLRDGERVYIDLETGTLLEL